MRPGLRELKLAREPKQKPIRAELAANWMPIGSPSGDQDSGTDMAGWPVMLNCAVKGAKAKLFAAMAFKAAFMSQGILAAFRMRKRNSSAPVIRLCPIFKGGAARTGLSMMSKRSK